MKKSDQDIETLTVSLKEAEGEIENLLRAGKIPTPTDYSEIDRIKRELKKARMNATRQANRGTKPLLNVYLHVNVSEEVNKQIEGLAAAASMPVTRYLREIIDHHISLQVIDFSSGFKVSKNSDTGKVEGEG